ncbi:NF-X-like 1 [Wolffia australiana]
MTPGSAEILAPPPGERRASRGSGRAPRRGGNAGGGGVHRQEWVPRNPAPPIQAEPLGPAVESAAEPGVRARQQQPGRRNRQHRPHEGPPPSSPATPPSARPTAPPAPIPPIPAPIPVAAPSVPQLVQELQEKLSKGAVECMICYDMVRRSAAIWSCGSCFSIFHLHCIKKWAKSPTSVDLAAASAASAGLNWRCPGCQSVQLTPSKDLLYTCFCGRQRDPPSDPYLIPHSCGEPCGKPLDRSRDEADDGTRCPHTCVLQCHPGPCPPCKAFAPRRRCPCGKQTLARRCSDKASPLSCGQTCSKLLLCGRHRCDRVCHTGPCNPCLAFLTASCFCRKKTEGFLCGEMPIEGEFSSADGIFSCNSTCGRALPCGNHHCTENCHPGPCGDCLLLPSKLRTCPCGKTKLTKPRSSCSEPVPTCSLRCSKLLPCGTHRCETSCHEGACPPCQTLVKQNCRCGSASREVECFETSAKDEENSSSFSCDKPCGKKKSCGRHRCNNRCCPLVSHLCQIPCGKKLRCGQHSCSSLCHSGYCAPCPETIFVELSCACGRTTIPPPQPCGTPLPSCPHPCRVPQACGHEPAHACHFGDCPPCSVPVSKACIGGHVVLKNLPCGSKDIRCNQLCGKTRRCGIHACARTCHPPPCDPPGSSLDPRSSSCGQVCGAPRRDCYHSCAANCHPSSPCPDLRCEFPVPVSCSCGRKTETAPCGGTVAPRRLACDEECEKAERRRVLAEAFAPSPSLGESPVAPELDLELLRREPRWALAVEERFRALVLGRAPARGTKVHVFCPMVKDKRDAVRALAERWRLAVHATGWEPRRYLTVRVTPKTRPPVGGGGKPAGLPAFNPALDMDPRLVVALLELQGEADISALVLRFGGDCDLVWLNEKNALAVFANPARAVTAMRCLDSGTPYRSAAVLPEGAGPSAAAKGEGPWKKHEANPMEFPAAVVGASLRGAKAEGPWKKLVTREANSSAAAGEGLVTAAPNRWSILEDDAVAPELAAATAASAGPLLSEEVDDWEKLSD